MTLTTSKRQMFHIMAVDPGAKILLSKYTHQWYVETVAEVVVDRVLSGICHHHDVPGHAVSGAFHEMRAAETLKAHGKYYRWNGGAFAEVPKP